MFCNNCGKEIDDNALVCENCGAPTYNMSKQTDNGGFGWGLLGFLVPIVGLILFLVWKDTKPKTSKVAGIGALVSFIIRVVLSILSIAIFSLEYYNM